MTHAEWFNVVECGIGRWEVRHTFSDEFAGTLTRTPTGYVLRDETEKLGVFATRDDALEQLYAVA